MEIVVSGIIIGIILSFVLIGPVFFLLLETSINKGWRQAIFLDLGVIFCDLLFISVFYYFLKDVTAFIEQSPHLKDAMTRIGGLVILIYGLVLVFKKENFKSMRKKMLKTASSNYFVTFTNGFLLNLMNLGVIFFWFGLVSNLAVKYPHPKDFIVLIGIAFTTFFILDLLKIFAAHRLKKVLNVRTTIMLRRFMGVILVVIALVMFASSFGVFDSLDHSIDPLPEILDRS